MSDYGPEVQVNAALAFTSPTNLTTRRFGGRRIIIKRLTSPAPRNVTVKRAQKGQIEQHALNEAFSGLSKEASHRNEARDNTQGINLHGRVSQVALSSKIAMGAKTQATQFSDVLQNEALDQMQENPLPIFMKTQPSQIQALSARRDNSSKPSGRRENRPASIDPRFSISEDSSGEDDDKTDVDFTSADEEASFTTSEESSFYSHEQDVWGNSRDILDEIEEAMRLRRIFGHGKTKDSEKAASTTLSNFLPEERLNGYLLKLRIKRTNAASQIQRFLRGCIVRARVKQAVCDLMNESFLRMGLPSSPDRRAVVQRSQKGNNLAFRSLYQKRNLALLAAVQQFRRVVEKAERKIDAFLCFESYIAKTKERAEFAREVLVYQSALKIQATWCNFNERKRIAVGGRALLRLQAHIRGTMERLKYRQVMHSVRRIQCMYRDRLLKETMGRMNDRICEGVSGERKAMASWKIQHFLRRVWMQRLVRRMRFRQSMGHDLATRRLTATRMVWQAILGWALKWKFQRLVRNTVRMQAAIRRESSVRTYRKAVAARRILRFSRSIQLQVAIRRFLIRLSFGDDLNTRHRNAAIVVQRIFRGWYVTNMYRQILQSILSVQTVARRYLASSSLGVAIQACCTVQSAYRRYIERQRSAVVIQAACRRYSSVQLLCAALRACRIIQWHWHHRIICQRSAIVVQNAYRSLASIHAASTVCKNFAVYLPTLRIGPQGSCLNVFLLENPIELAALLSSQKVRNCTTKSHPSPCCNLSFSYSKGGKSNHTRSLALFSEPAAIGGNPKRFLSDDSNNDTEETCKTYRKVLHGVRTVQAIWHDYYYMGWRAHRLRTMIKFQNLRRAPKAVLPRRSSPSQQGVLDYSTVADIFSGEEEDIQAIRIVASE
ncbi:predicted protein [Phaeodactylum tricornutum CCAP 1055/1]|uniref:Uncharacterized protein n=2 Tax=Phaeodactylum tricornutum TaxID=2850 RepID=B7FYU7_PHATC|nr:predicted protein [Phaeodactylum tricornutum CCAP 1055/1]EEC48421.1 predicted protein [Phaeodactylum tricornutum CCAP 1055/1]|eukprot:XP_002180230.1 predicted protein [Phaeodactylum tricornutum CCAP 1055/1]